MAWVESNQEIWQHPKTRKLARLLGASVPTAVGYLHGLWYWALSYAQDGIIGRYDAEEIADAVLWDGDPAAFIKALIASGYADETPDGTELHDWYEYTGRLMEQREIKKEQARVRKRRERERKKETPDDGPASVTRDCHDFTLLPTNQSTVQTDSTETLPTDNTTLDPPERGRDAGGKDSSLYEQRFSEFWKAYPKKVGKTAALKSWLRIKPTAELHAKIMQAVAWQSKTEQWTKDGGQFIPNPTTWLNQGRWENEPMGGGVEHGTGTDQQHPQSWTRGFHE